MKMQKEVPPRLELDSVQSYGTFIRLFVHRVSGQTTLYLFAGFVKKENIFGLFSSFPFAVLGGIATIRTLSPSPSLHARCKYSRQNPRSLQPRPAPAGMLVVCLYWDGEYTNGDRASESRGEWRVT